MLFNSIDFIIFLPIVFILYWFVVNGNIKRQNSFLLIASYVFYGWWDWRFLSLIIISSTIDYLIGLQLNRQITKKKRQLFLVVSIIVNISFLGFFKYYNFFIDSLVDSFTFFGAPLDPRRLNIVLPVGISFYTFQTLSYTIDVYRRKLKPTKDIIAFFAFVSFFPQLVAGPIERATNLLPQFAQSRKFDKSKAIDGLRQMLWGLFKKVVIADNLSALVDPIFRETETMPSWLLVLGLALFSVQIYADFAGYSDIAIGCARLFGFNLKINFRYPLFARSVGERWRNWHISLSTWFRDYIYIPLGGSRVNRWKQFRNVMILFTISGFWHGANWTFVAWGFLNGLYFAPSMLLGRNRRHLDVVSKGRTFPKLLEIFQMIVTFWLITTTYLFFRAENIQHSWRYAKSIVNNINVRISIDTIEIMFIDIQRLTLIAIFCIVFLIAEWINREREHTLENIEIKLPNPTIRWSVYYSLIFLIFFFGGSQETFIYFQF